MTLVTTSDPMKYIPIALTLLITMSAHKCNDKTAAAVGGESPAESVQKMGSLLDTKWLLHTLKGNVVAMPDDKTAPWLKLNKEGDQLEGFGGCNNMMGGFTLTGDKISFPGLASTKKFCEATMPTENAFMTALRNTTAFKMEGNVLKFLGDGGADLATFKPE